MKPTFSLIDEPWIPCIDQQGRPIELGLYDTLARAHTLRAVHGETPVVTAALYRLLLAVLQRVYMPDSMAAWGALWARRRWETAPLDAYFAAWRHRFDLFDPTRPFYQAPDVRVKPRPPRPMICLALEMASGNNATLFDHHTEEIGAAFTPAEAARILVTIQPFGIAGLSGLPQNFTDGTCTRGAVFLVEGDTLFETFALNLLPYGDAEPIPSGPEDRPAWEMDDPFTPDRAEPFGYLDYLTWQNRRVLLQPEDGPGGTVVRWATMEPALRLAAGLLDPMKHYRRDEKQGMLMLRFREDKALWRDSTALFQLRAPDEVRPPKSFRWLADLSREGMLDERAIYRYMALGMANDQAKVHFYRAEHMPLPLEYLNREELVVDLADALKAAENTGDALCQATRTLASAYLTRNPEQKEKPDDVKKLVAHLGAEPHYWSRLEAPFHTLVVALTQDRDAARTVWQQTLRQVAWDALERAGRSIGQDAFALKAQVRARGRLAFLLAKALPGLKEEP